MGNHCALIGSFSVRIFQFGLFPWNWTNLCIFVLERSRQIKNFQPKQRKKRVWILSFFKLKLPEEAKKIKIFPKFQRWMKQTNIFKCKPAEVHFTIGNRVPYNNQLARAVLGNIGPRLWQYRPVFARYVLPRPCANILQYGPHARLVSS